METPLHRESLPLGSKETVDLLRKHGGKTSAELKAEELAGVVDQA